MVRLAFLTEKAEYGRQRRQADAAFPQAGGVQPRLVEFEPGRQQIGDALMEARHEQSSNARVSHVT